MMDSVFESFCSKQETTFREMVEAGALSAVVDPQETMAACMAIMGNLMSANDDFRFQNNYQSEELRKSRI